MAAATIAWTLARFFYTDRANTSQDSQPEDNKASYDTYFADTPGILMPSLGILTPSLSLLTPSLGILMTILGILRLILGIFGIQFALLQDSVSAFHF